MMSHIFIAVFTCVVLSTVSGRSTGSACDFTQEKIQKDIMECAVHEPFLMVEIVKHMDNPKGMLSSDFICSNIKALADIFVCLESKTTECLSSEQQNILLEMLPSKQRLENLLQFVCQHKTELIETQCMDSDQVREFMQCYAGKLQGIQLFGFNKDNIQSTICSIATAEESCLSNFHGTCSEQVVSLLYQTLEKMFNLDSCPKQLNNPFDSILVHGQPLQFKPQGDIGYNIVTN
ncbi:uncharacterized protein LOC131927261 [Physella acuta]|uniref:uncharacterized protein LOC131927261 n=1 Tax=Physella acuta TaxID=109671 RepID=UPI0027DAC9F7|nr:uncharacterized protein LOC131927261 [Physella acuta]